MRNAPCLNCEKRHRACHDTCPEYQEYHKHREEILEKQQQFNMLEEIESTRDHRSWLGWKRDGQARRKRRAYNGKNYNTRQADE